MGAKKISAKNFDNFTKDLKKYIEHYEGLANATKEFEINIEQTKIRTLALQKILQNYTVERLTTINDKKITIPENYSLTDIIANYYQDDILIEKITSIEKENKNSPSSLLTDKRLVYPVTALNQARFITDELENITNQYTRAHYSYFKMILDTLEKSKKLQGANPTSIDDKKVEIEQNLNIWIKKFENLADSKDVKKNLEN